MRKSLSISFLLLLTCFLFAQKEDLNNRFLQAVKEGNVQDVELCLKKGADINSIDKNNLTALHIAAVYNKMEMFEFLLTKGQNINILDSEGATPLFAAAATGNLRMCHFLILKGANLGIKDKNGSTARDYAKAAGYSRVEKYLSDINTYSEEPTYLEYYFIGSNFHTSGKYNEAIINYEKAITTLKNEVSNPNNPDNAYLLNSLALIYHKKGNFSKAEPLFLEALKIRKEILGVNHPDYAISLNNLATLYDGMGNYSKAESTYLEVLNIKRETIGVNNTSYATTLNNLAGLYLNEGNYLKAESLCEQALNITKEALGENHPDYAISLINLAGLYLKKGNYLKAEQIYQKALKIQKEVLGTNNLDYAVTLGNLAGLYTEMGKYSIVEKMYEEVLYIKKEILGINHPSYLITLNKLGILYDNMNNFSKAESIYLQVIKSQKEILGEKHPNYITTLSNLAVLYQNMGMYKKAEPILIKSLTLTGELVGKNHPDYEITLGNLGLLYQQIGNYQKAELLLIEALGISKNTLGESHPDYASNLNYLGGLYQEIGKYQEAKKIFKQVLDLRKKVLGENHPEYSTSLNNLASLYHDMGNYQEAESIYKEVLKLTKEQLGENHSYYVQTLNNLATLLQSKGNFQQAELLFEQAIRIDKSIFGENNFNTATLYNNFGTLYQEMGNFPKALKFYTTALLINKETVGENHRDYALSLSNISSLYEKMGNFQEAEILSLQTIKIIKEVLGENHSDYARSLNNLAFLYQNMGDFQKAEPLYVQALKIRKNTFGENHPDYACSLNNIGFLNYKIEKFEKAEPFYKQALAIWKVIYGEKHPSYAVALNNLAALYFDLGQYTKAEQIILEASKYTKNFIFELFSFLSEHDRNIYWDQEQYKFYKTYPSFTYKYHTQKPSISNFAYDNALFTKGLLLNTSLQIQNAVLQSGDSALINTWENLRGLKRTINLLQSKPFAQQGDLSIMEAQVDSLDKVLTQKSQLYKQSQEDMQVKWTDVQKNLKPDEAAIEFISFNYFNKHYTDSTLYCALVLKKNSQYPEMIPLFEEKQLDSLFVSSSTDVNQLYTFRVTNLRKDNIEQTLNYGSKLYNLLWKPLEASLKNTKTVYFAPSGKLHQVAFAAIPVDSTLLLSDKYNLHQVTSTRQVVKSNNGTANKQNAVLFGGIQYELDNKQLAQVQLQTTSSTNYRSAFVSDSTQRSNTFGYLKGTGEEVTGIADEFKQKGLTEQLYTGAIASEAAFKTLNGTNTDIIHIATHGFYLPIEKTKQEDFRFMGLDNERRNVVYQNPLLRSGLVFAGANRAWRGDTIPDNWEDGILTAHEISQINLTHTDLVVLSACETALGDVKGSEGVFGLQRAFKMAGVQTLIMSLWKVPDTQTSQLMQGFYKYWLGGMTKHEAFKKAQNEVRATSPNPYYWAAFVMVD